MDSFSGIPDEMIEQILGELSARDILVFSTTCRRMKKVVDHSALIRLIFELSTYGYRLLSDWRTRTDGRSIQELFISFRAKQKRWETFDFADRKRALVGCRETRLENGVLGTIDIQFLRFYRLNHPLFKSGDYRPWGEHELGREYPNHCWDESQDLLVLFSRVNTKVLLRTLSGDEPHYLAELPELTLKEPASSMRILGDNLIALFYPSSGTQGTTLVVWNWKTGSTIFGPISNMKGLGFITLTDDLLMTVMEDYNNRNHYVAVYSLSSRNQRLHLLLPFATVPSVYIGRTEIVSMKTPITYYHYDPAADRISYIWFRVGSDMFNVVLSTHQLMKLVPSPTEYCRKLDWSEWGPTCTRWFRKPSQLIYSSAQCSWMYFSKHVTEFIDINNIFPNSYSDAAVAFCDFNPRIIRRSQHLPITTREANPQDIQLETIPAEKATEEDVSMVTSNLIAQRIVTEESVLYSPFFTESVHSRLPFRIFIRKKVEGWERCPVMGADPIAVFSDDTCFDVYYF